MNTHVHVVCPKCEATNRVESGRIGAGANCGQCKAPLFPEHPIELTQKNFERQLANSDLPVIVDFWAPWCGPCRAMAPAFEEAAARLAPRARLAKLNTEAEPELASRYGIRSIPTLIAFSHGRETARQSGALDVAGVLSWVMSSV